MFPSQGLFCSISCPDYLEGNCQRIYCQFSHSAGKALYDAKFNKATASKSSEIEQSSASTYFTSKVEEEANYESIKSNANDDAVSEDSPSYTVGKLVICIFLAFKFINSFYK